MQAIQTIGEEPNVQFAVGPFRFSVDDTAVLVTKASGDSILTIGMHEYKSNDAACDAAWKLANRQARA